MKPAHCGNKIETPLFNYILPSVCLFFMTPLANGQDYPKCSQDHPGQQHRAESVVKRGDSRMVLSAGGHAVLYAIERYKLKDLVTETDITKAQQQMYNFLVWKLGGPSGAAAQFITAGYQHFDKGYVDEAAGVLLEIIRFTKKEPEMMMPYMLQRYFELQKGLRTAIQITEYLIKKGVNSQVAGVLGKEASEQMAGAATGRGAVGVFIPKSYDVDNRIVEEAIKAKQWDAGDGNTTGTKPETGDRKTPTATNESENTSPNDSSSTSIEGGYESIYLKVTADEVEVQVRVNGKLVGIYNKGTTVYLDPFLKQNIINTINFIFSGVPKYFDNVDIDGKFPGNDKWFDVYNFAPKQGKLESKFELPFAGKRN